MKKLLAIILMCLSFSLSAQSNKESGDIEVPRYKIYPTENFHISLKLDTATGRIWMVQIGVGDTESMTATLNDESLIMTTEEVRAGRFELYPTKNTYNFILLDTEKGYTFQVQWHTDVDKRIIDLIW